MKRILIVANVSSFLYKFERGDVRILQSLGYEVHCAANMHEQHHEGETQVMEQMGVIMHHISVARSPYLYHDNRTALAQLLLLIEKLDIRVLHCHTPVGGVLGRPGWQTVETSVFYRAVYRPWLSFLQGRAAAQ